MTKDNQAFRKELVSLLPRLRRFALALACDADLAEDLLQAAIERALRKWEMFEPGRRLESWMFKIMQNLWFDMRRSAKKGPIYTDLTLDMAGDDGRVVVESREELRLAREAFSELPEDQRAVMALVVLEGFSYAEASSALDVPIGTIMSRLARARSAIARRVQSPASISPVEKYN